jgi:class 3 adenylate cyclase
MTISYVQDDDWMVWEITATVIVSFILSLLIYTILVQKQNYKSIEKKYLEDLAQPQKLRLRLFLEEGARNASVVNIEDLIHNRKPIADLYSNTTVLFCDISGFTAWSSEREPAQVFTLLQVIFHSFDKIASSVGVFNVETIGDCYVAITGFPEAQADHAVRMVDFAQQCLTKAKELTKRLEMTLGPDTEDLGFRFSLHSGPVTAGVLVSERSRFQLFGETVKVASRLESTAQRNRIQISQATADFLIQAGKGKCIKPLEEQATIKGMGTFQTYWFVPPRKLKQQRSLLSAGISSAAEVASSLDVHTEETKSQTGGDDSERPSTLWGGDDDDDLSEADMAAEKDKAQRLIEWHVDSMSRLLKMIVARKGKNKKSSSITKTFANLASAHAGDTLLDEIVEVIQLPKLDEKSKRIVHPESITLAPEVTSQLRDYVTEIAALYRPNHFHNFEHASHVTMSVHKLLNRIVTPDSIDCNRDNVKAVMNDLHNYTFGITSDPLTHFAVVFCALVHDVDHTGVSNAQRGKEEPKLAEHYMSKSLAEQNSVDLSWEVLMKPKYKDLHSCLFSNEKDLMRFRQIVVNIVLATDIFDKEFKELRNLRWNKAFHPDQFDASTGSVSSTSPSSLDLSSSDQAEPMEGTRGYATNRKATIVIEHIMQASDVAHTMQHWHIYQKWNERLFNEMSEAYKMGRSPSDPSQGWYKGELWFFDNYVIPLATKLEECGVFGVASDECLFNALNNRKEWACRGEKTVEEMVERRRKSEEGSS